MVILIGLLWLCLKFFQLLVTLYDCIFFGYSEGLPVPSTTGGQLPPMVTVTCRIGFSVALQAALSLCAKGNFVNKTLKGIYYSLLPSTLRMKTHTSGC